MVSFSEYVSTTNEAALPNAIVTAFTRLPMNVQIGILSGALAAGVAGAQYLAPFKGNQQGQFNNPNNPGATLGDPSMGIAPSMSNLGGSQ